VLDVLWQHGREGKRIAHRDVAKLPNVRADGELASEIAVRDVVRRKNSGK
jgi:hypothetical protein